MLRAALQRTYSGSPHEAFFTAGGMHDFENFEPSEGGRVISVSEGFQESVNLVFIRLMRDIERYYRFRVPGASPSVLTDTADPGRRRYLQRFADWEGRTFLRRFYEKYKGRTPDQALHELTSGVRLTPRRAAVIFPLGASAGRSGCFHSIPPGASAGFGAGVGRSSGVVREVRHRQIQPQRLWLPGACPPA
jgi:hypothetical protein